MEAVLSTWSTKDLKDECAKHGMAQYGDKATLIQRIIDNVPGKRKPGRKPNKPNKTIAKAKKTYTMPMKLDKKQMDAMGVKLDKEQNGTFIYTSVDAVAKTPPTKKPAAKKLTSANVKAATAATEDDSDDDDDGSSESGDSQRSDDLLDDETFKTYYTSMTDRLVQQPRVTKKMLHDMAAAFDPKAKLSGADKTELAEMVVTSLMYETDEDE